MNKSKIRAFNPLKVPAPPEEQRLNVAGILAPLDLEIGCGNGFHAIAYAKSSPERHLIAIERTHNKFRSFQSRLKGHPQLKNINAIHSDAISWVSHCLPEEALSRVFLLYPNPYPKSRQANHRWVNMPFFGYLLRCLKPGGELVLATNEEFYYLEARKRAVQTWGLEVKEDEVVSSAAKPRTHFEKKYLERGETCWNLVFRRP